MRAASGHDRVATLLGAGDAYVAFRVILPNCLSSIIVQTSLSVAMARERRGS